MQLITSVRKASVYADGMRRFRAPGHGKPTQTRRKKSGNELEIWLLRLPFSGERKSDAQETVKLENVFMR